MNTTPAGQPGSAIKALHPRQMGALPLLYPILSNLEVRQTVNELVSTEADIDLGRIVVLLTLNRLLAPQPLYQVQDWLVETVLPEVLGILPEQASYDNRLGRALDRLYPHLGELWARLASRAVQVYDLDLNVLHWDITSIYFEGAYTDSELVTYGYSRDHRPDTKQVNLELDVSHDGYVPVLYQVLPGNTADITRPLPHLRTLLHFLSRPELAERQLRPILVSDCKMVTPEAALACHRHNLFYLGPLPNGTATEQLLRSVSAEELATHPLAYRPQRVKADDSNFVPYQGVWHPFTFEHSGQLITDRALDGRYALATNATHLDADQALTLFKGQDGVEKRIRDVKGPLVVHPLFVRTDRRIEGLVFITLLALLVRAILERTCRQRGLALSSQRLFQGFANLQAVDVVWSDGSRQRLAAELSAFQAAVIHTLGWPAPEHYAGLTPLER